MPIYEYTCQACGHALESLQKMTDPALIDCPQCGKPELKKMISAAGFQLKGGGWYATDFKGPGKVKHDEPAPSSGAGTPGGGCGSGGCGHSH